MINHKVNVIGKQGNIYGRTEDGKLAFRVICTDDGLHCKLFIEDYRDEMFDVVETCKGMMRRRISP